MKKSVIYLLILASLFALITGCDNEHGNTVSSSDDGRYYIRYESSDGGVAYCLDLSDGRIIVACPDPLCSIRP